MQIFQSILLPVLVISVLANRDPDDSWVHPGVNEVSGSYSSWKRDQVALEAEDLEPPNSVMGRYVKPPNQQHARDVREITDSLKDEYDRGYREGFVRGQQVTQAYYKKGALKNHNLDSNESEP